MKSWQDLFVRISTRGVDLWIKRVIILNSEWGAILQVVLALALIVSFTIMLLLTVRKARKNSPHSESTLGTLLEVASIHSSVALFFSFVAGIGFYLVSRHLMTPSNVFKLFKVKEIWAIAHQGIAELLDYLRFATGIGLGFFLVSVLGLIVFWIPVKRPPTFVLSFVKFNEDKFPGDKWKIWVGEKKTDEWSLNASIRFGGEHLFVVMTPKSTELRVSSHEPEPGEGEQLIRLYYQKGKLEGHIVSQERQEFSFCSDDTYARVPAGVGKKFWVCIHPEGKRDKWDKVAQFEFQPQDVSKVSRLMVSLILSILVSIALLLLLKSIAVAWTSSPALAAGRKHASMTQSQPCLSFQKAELVYRSPTTGSTEEGKWLILGKLKINQVGLVEDDNFKLLVRIGNNSAQEIRGVVWQRLPPLLVKFLFDLERDAAYLAPSENPLYHEVIGGVDAEIDFWEAVIDQLLSDFDFNGQVGGSDVGIVYATWSCKEKEPGVSLYAQSQRLEESITRERLFDRIKMVINECFYQVSPQPLSRDVSQEVYEAGIPKEVARDWPHGDQYEIAGNQLLVILRWYNAEIPIDYEVLHSGAVSNEVVIINFGRNFPKDAPHRIMGIRLLSVNAPTRSKLQSDADIRGLAILASLAAQGRSYVNFEADFPDHIPLNEVKDVALTAKHLSITNPAISCESDEAQLDQFQFKDPPFLRPPVYITYGLWAVAILFGLQISIAGIVIVTYLSKRFRDDIDSFRRQYVRRQ